MNVLFNDRDPLFVVSIDPTAEWHHSTFPDPLITVDHDKTGSVIKVVVLGDSARKLKAALDDCLAGLTPALTAERVPDPITDERAKLLAHSPDDYRAAPSGEGPLKREWRDKPHRLIYDLVGEVERLRADNQALSDRIAADYQEKADMRAALDAALNGGER